MESKKFRRIGLAISHALGVGIGRSSRRDIRKYKIWEDAKENVMDGGSRNMLCRGMNIEHPTPTPHPKKCCDRLT